MLKPFARRQNLCPMCYSKHYKAEVLVYREGTIEIVRCEDCGWEEEGRSWRELWRELRKTQIVVDN